MGAEVDDESHRPVRCGGDVVERRERPLSDEKGL